MLHKFVSVIIPTFREKDKIKALLNCFAKVNDINVKIIIINGDPGDETSTFLNEQKDPRVLELYGNPNLFWAGLVNIGLRYILQNETSQAFVIIMNADIEFEANAFTSLIAKAETNPNAQIAPLTVANYKIISSGVKVVSWLFTLNRHPLAGQQCDKLQNNILIPADFLPTRCTLIPFSAVKRAGLINENRLPHYGADYEYTNRIRKQGCPTYIFTGALVCVDTKSTGIDVFHKIIPLADRLRSVFSIKSTFNPVYRLRFVQLVYPPYAWPSAMLLYLVRSLLEVLIGGAAIKSIFCKKESGISGT